MSLLSRLFGGAKSAMLGYDAIEPKDRRKSPPVSAQSEDRLLPTGKRDLLAANARDLNRNYSVAASAIRQHLNYVCSHRFAGRCADQGLSRALEQRMEFWSRREGCDAAGRHRLSRFIRLAEIRRILDGDVGILRLANGQLQGIEGDRIRNPGTSVDDSVWTNGVKCNDSGRALAYSIWKRTRYGGMQFERTIAASNVFMHGFYDRFDQIRGVSPVAAALNQFRDVYENFDYALAKAKVTQLFALAFYREATEAAGEVTAAGTEEDESESTGYKVDFGRGPAVLDLDPGDRAEFLESQTPSTQFQDFTKLVTMVALKSLDIPYSFFDESHTNFFGSRGAFLHYDRSCQEKREDVQDLLRWITAWRVKLWIADGEITLPRGAGPDAIAWEWVPQGMPFWDPVKEVTGALSSIAGGLDSPYRVARETGSDFERNVEDMSRAIAFARSKGVRLSYDLEAVDTAATATPEIAAPTVEQPAGNSEIDTPNE